VRLEVTQDLRLIVVKLDSFLLSHVFMSLPGLIYISENPLPFSSYTYIIRRVLVTVKVFS
jgi:hypothetical protein